MIDTKVKEIGPVDLGEKFDSSCNIDTKKKKKSNKKNNKTTATVAPPLPPYYEQALASYPLKLKNSKAKGRHAVAQSNLEPGITVCHEQATAFVVRSEYIDQQCHVCLSDLKQKRMCSDCKKAFYCSQDCLEKDNDLHVLICRPIAQTEAIGLATDVDVDLLRLMTSLMARRYLDTQRQDSKESDIQSTPYWCVEDLISHRENAGPAFITVLTEASERLVQEMPESIQFPVDDMVTLACRINANAHGLGDNHSRNTDVALGLFPLGALFFNHSCNPNTAFIGLPNGQLAFRTIRPVTKDEELVVSYIDLYSDRDERRQELLQSKHFWCKCKRCTSPMEKSVDRFLQGVVCTQCKDDVYVIPATSVERLSKEIRNLYTEQQGVFKCAKCESEIPCDQVRESLENAGKSYGLGMTAIRQKRNYTLGAQQLEQITKCNSYRGGDLHTLNAFRLNALIPLMNCKRHAHDLKGAIDVNKSILVMMEQYAVMGALPANTSEISDFWQNLGELSCAMANETKGRSSILEKKWRKEASTAFAHALKIRTVVFGKNHPKTKYIEKSVSCSI